jgi:hypothetical protein
MVLLWQNGGTGKATKSCQSATEGFKFHLSHLTVIRRRTQTRNRAARAPPLPCLSCLDSTDHAGWPAIMLPGAHKTQAPSIINDALHCTPNLSLSLCPFGAVQHTAREWKSSNHHNRSTQAYAPHLYMRVYILYVFVMKKFIFFIIRPPLIFCH